MKKFTCRYLDEKGQWDREAPYCEIEADSAEEAARIFAEKYPSENPKIQILWGFLSDNIVVDNDNPVRREREAALVAARIESLETLATKVENTNGNLADLSYADLTALIENMRDFPEIRDELSPEECVVREKLYMIAFFDRDLQAGLQTSLLNQIASGQPTAGVASSGQSNLTRNAAMLAGGAVALQKLTQIEENTGDVSEGLGFD